MEHPSAPRAALARIGGRGWMRVHVGLRDGFAAAAPRSFLFFVPPFGFRVPPQLPGDSLVVPITLFRLVGSWYLTS